MANFGILNFLLFSTGMGQLGGHNHIKGKVSRLFTGEDASYPIELFIYVVENETQNQRCGLKGRELHEHTFKVAWDLINQDPLTPAGNT